MRLARRRAFVWRQPLELQILWDRNWNHLFDLLAVIGLDRHDRERVRWHRHLQRLAGLNPHLDVRDNILHSQLREALGDIAAGKAAGIIRLILKPQPHIAFRRFRDGELHLIHMLR